MSKLSTRAKQTKRRKPNKTSSNTGGIHKAKARPKTARPRTDRKAIGALFEDLVALQARLRAPNGCPWDREQTHQSLRTYLLEETYEVLDALDRGDFDEFAGELGDLLLQVVFHAELASEAGRFDVGDVIKGIHDKMVRRHPHVFGDAKANTAAQVLKNWEQLKAAERAADSKDSASAAAKLEKPADSLLDAVPRSLPALLEAHQMSRRAANVGFDWKQVDGLFEKLAEETGELHQALAVRDRTRQEEEVGDMLFLCVNLARFLGFDAEIALKKTNRKFSMRFRDMERSAAARGERLSELTPDQLENLWQEAKQRAAQKAL